MFWGLALLGLMLVVSVGEYGMLTGVRLSITRDFGPTLV